MNVTPANAGVSFILLINNLGDACIRRHDRNI